MPIVTAPLDVGDAPYDDRDQRDIVFAEGQLVEDDGTLIKTYAVYLGQAADHRWPNEMPVVVKGSAQRFAIEHCLTIRLNKPEVFRNQDETLISDQLVVHDHTGTLPFQRVFRPLPAVKI